MTKAKNYPLDLHLQFTTAAFFRQAEVTLRSAQSTADHSDESGARSTHSHSLEDAHPQATCSTQPAAQTEPSLSMAGTYNDILPHSPYYHHNNSFEIPLGDG